MVRKKVFLLLGGVILVLLLGSLHFAAKNNPSRVLKSYFKATQEHRAAAVKTFFVENPDLVPATDEWVAAQNTQFTIKEESAWKEDENRFKPFSKYFSSNYKAVVSVQWEDKTKEFSFHFIRKGSKDSWSIFGNIYKDWKIRDINKGR